MNNGVRREFNRRNPSELVAVLLEVFFIVVTPVRINFRIKAGRRIPILASFGADRVAGRAIENRICHLDWNQTVAETRNRNATTTLCRSLPDLQKNGRVRKLRLSFGDVTYSADSKFGLGPRPVQILQPRSLNYAAPRPCFFMLPNFAQGNTPPH